LNSASINLELCSAKLTGEEENKKKMRSSKYFPLPLAETVVIFDVPPQGKPPDIFVNA
jgi:hypothetical protein